MNSIRDLRLIIGSYDKLSLFHKLFISIRYLIVPWNKVVNSVGVSGKVLDIGSGHFLFPNLLCGKRPDINCYGYEPDGDKIRLITDNLKVDRVHVVSKEHLQNLPDNIFDYITIVDVLYCVEPDKWSDILDLAHRLLKPTGQLIVKETDNKPWRKYAWCLFQEYLAIKVLRFTQGSTPHFFAADYYVSKFKKNGFEIVNHYAI